jgi:peptidoglycan/LPS O-acetylase OafA/YrhL
MPTHMIADDTRSEGLDALRGVAILLVLLCHAWQPLTGFFPAAFALTWSGVDLFFVLSGYLIGGGLIDHRTSENLFAVFYARRAARILPLYALLLLMLAIDGTATPFWRLLTFTQNFGFHDLVQYDLSVVVTWSLAVEEQFYLVLPLLVCLLPPRWLPAVAIVLAASAPLWRAVLDPIDASALLPCRMDALFLGVLCAWAVRQPRWRILLERRRASLHAAIAVGAAGFVVMTWADVTGSSPGMWTLGVSWLAVFYALLVLTAVTARPLTGWLRWARRPLCLMGLCAYGLYLFHVPLLRRALYLPPLLEPWVYLLVLGILTYAMWRGIEQPAIAYARQRWRYDRQALPPDAALLAAVIDLRR